MQHTPLSRELPCPIGASLSCRCTCSAQDSTLEDTTLNRVLREWHFSSNQLQSPISACLKMEASCVAGLYGRRLYPPMTISYTDNRASTIRSARFVLRIFGLSLTRTGWFAGRNDESQDPSVHPADTSADAWCERMWAHHGCLLAMSSYEDTPSADAKLTSELSLARLASRTWQQ